MKIIHLISGGDVGGAKTHVLSLLHGLLETEQAQLVCFMDGPFAQEARELGIPTLVLDSGGVRTICQKLAALIRDGGYQIIHCHGSRANMMGALLRRRCGVPVVTTVHSDYRLDYLGRPLHRLIYGTINTVALRMLDYRIGVSDAMAELLIRRGFDAQRMFSIYNGVDFTPVTPALERDAYFESIGLQTEPDSVVFGIAARISPVKDMTTLIRAFSQAVKVCPSIRLVIAGDGEQAEQIKALAAETCPAGTVVFAGWVTDMDSFYNAIDVNTLTSLSETFPYALTEGVRMHCATIASRVGGVPVLIDDGVSGLLFAPQDADMLARHMIAVAQDADYRLALAERLYEKAKAQFSAGATVAHQKEIYATILRRQARAGRKRDGVLICGAYGKGNAGDETILEAIVAQMHKIDPDLPLYVLTRTPRATAAHYRIGTVYTFNVPQFRRIMRRTQLYLNGGGSLIQDVTSTRSLFYYLNNIKTAYKLGNRVLMYGCGIGPVRKPYNQKKAAKVLNRYVDHITLREPSSQAVLAQMGVTRPAVTVTADPALLMYPAPPEKLESYLLSQNLALDGKYLLFALRPWSGFDRLAPIFISCAERFYREKGMEPVFFALEPGRDLSAIAIVTEQLHCPYHVISAPPDGGLLIGLMGRMEAVLSMRLHPLVFASSQGVPLIGFVYDPKVQAFLDYLKEPNYFALDGVTEQALVETLHSALSTRADADARTERMRALAAKNGEIARQLLEEEAQ